MRMNSVFIFVVCIGFSGIVFSEKAHAQFLMDTSSAIESILSGADVSSENIVADIVGGLFTSESTEQPASAIEEPILIDIPDSTVNQGTAEAIDSRTGRYPPRLKLNHLEMPLRTWTSTKSAAKLNTISQRIQNRYRVQNVEIEIENRTAVVSGTAPSELMRRQAELTLLFEPGIDMVRNNIVVTP